MYTLNPFQINHISAGSGAAITGTTAFFFACYLYYTQEDQNNVKFKELENRLSKLEALANLTNTHFDTQNI